MEGKSLSIKVVHVAEASRKRAAKGDQHTDRHQYGGQYQYGAIHQHHDRDPNWNLHRHR